MCRHANCLLAQWCHSNSHSCVVMLARITDSLGLWFSCAGPPGLRACIQILVPARKNGPPGFLGTHGVSKSHWCWGGGVGDDGDDEDGLMMQTCPWGQEGCHGDGDKGSCKMTTCFLCPGRSRRLFRLHFLYLRCLATGYSASTRRCKKRQEIVLDYNVCIIYNITNIQIYCIYGISCRENITFSVYSTIIMLLLVIVVHNETSLLLNNY